jgi:hypothetical protein
MLALLGFILAVVALVSNILLAWVKVPRIVVQVTQITHISATVTITPTVTATAQVIPGEGQPPAGPSATPNAEPDDRADQPQGVADARDTFILTVINTGSEAITVRTIGFKSDAKPGVGGVWLDWDTERMFPGDYPQPDGPDLPVRIEGHGCEIWTYEDAALKRIPHGTTLLGYAKRYKTFRMPPRRRRTLDKMHFSEQRVYRNGG